MELPQLDIEKKSLKEKVLEVLSPLYIDEEKCGKLVSVFENEIQKGLENGLSASSLQMENTFIPELLDGSETGKFLALDLGGTNFRVIQLELKNGKIVDEIIDYYQVEEALRLGPGPNLFKFLAGCIKSFLAKHNITQEAAIPLGFTFSFPMEQKAVDVGLLVNWTKSFNCPGVIGEDVVKMLNQALSSEGVTNVNVVAILNDTTGTLVAGSHDYSNCAIGLILGTGSNAAYIENAEKVLRWGDSESKGHQGFVLMDPEMGAFGDNGCIDFIKTEWDRQLDQDSLLPGSFTYEKYFAGKYLGELVRLAFISALEKTEQDVPQNLKERDSISTSDVSEILSTSGIPEILKNLSDVQVAILKYACQVLSERAALLVSLTIATYLNRMARSQESVVAVTGSLYKHHPLLPQRLDYHTAKMTSYPFSYKLSDDGSGKGAGLVAAIVSRLKQS